MGYSSSHMIITRQKTIDELLSLLETDPVFIIGCSECATLCHTGGENEVQTMKKTLMTKGLQVTGSIVLDPACHLNNDKRLLKNYTDQITQAKKILVLACGTGAQTINELYPSKSIIAGTDTLFVGETVRADSFIKRCNLCGECILELFSGFCPVSRCPKSMLNGPCGGARNGKCELNSNLDCVWDQIFTNLKKKNALHLLQVIQPPKQWSKSLEMRR